MFLKSNERQQCLKKKHASVNFAITMQWRAWSAFSLLHLNVTF